MRKLASIQRIANLEPIPGADAIEKATVLGWELVVKKGEFKIGELCVYIEIDSVLPDKPEFEFMRDRKFRVKTIKLRGQISQGICFPLSILPEDKYSDGDDVTGVLGIVKYDEYQDQKSPKQGNKIRYPKWMPQWLQGFVHRFRFVRDYYRKHSGQRTFPALIPKTDETRVQVLQELLTKYKGTKCYITEKLDGSSITIYQINGKFGVCSRNIDLKRDPEDRFWKAALALDLENKLKTHYKGQNIALQGELIGEGVQGNKYKLKGNVINFFNVFFVKEFRYGNIRELLDICIELNISEVPILNVDFMLPDSIPELVEMSKGQSVFGVTIREGIVIRPMEEITDNDLHCQLVKNRISFKSVNPEFLLKYGG